MFKLRIYHTSGYKKGMIKKEEFFETRKAAENRYNELWDYNNYSYNPTLWILNPFNNQYERIMGY